MSSSSERKGNKLFSPRFEKLLMIVLPCLAIICCIAILKPHIMGLVQYITEKKVLSEQAQVPSSTVRNSDEILPSLQQRQWDACAPDMRDISLSVSSTQRDMYVTVRDSDNNVVTDEIFSVLLTSPFGDTAEYRTSNNGTCYIVDLAPGDYTVNVSGITGYSDPAPVKCSVRDAAAFVPIQNISELIDVVDAAEIPAFEIKANPQTASTIAVPELITAPQAISFSESVVATPAPLTDAHGYQLYSYTYELGSTGHLLFSGTTQESDVLPVDEDGDGVYEHGIRYVQNTLPSVEPSFSTELDDDASLDGAGEEGADDNTQENSQSGYDGYYVSVALYNIDNTPVELYAIHATALVAEAMDADAGYGWKSESGRTYYYTANGEKAVGLKSIDGKLYYFNEHGEKASQLGIDVSCFNGNIDWNAVKAQGIEFVIMRIGGRGWSSGLVYEDSNITNYLNGAKNAGLKLGVYFYSCAINKVEAIQEASVVLEKLGGMRLDFPVFIDMEYSGSYPHGRADTLSTSLRVEIANAFCKTVMNGGYASGIYAGEYYMKNELDYHSLSGYTYWLANYTENNRLPTFSGRYSIWQFTDRAQISGINGCVDMNVIF